MGWATCPALHRRRARVFAVAETAPLHVQLIAKTDFVTPPDVAWGTDADGGEALVEFAGRACYQSWSKPNPKTATNAGYLRHIIDVGHFSVLEHASVSFYITGISRSCTHELIRHRHFSYSQLSQRYVPENESQIVVPPGIEDDEELRRILAEAADASRATYSELLNKLEAKFARVSRPKGACCAANRPVRPRGPYCRMPPRPASWSPATTAPGGTSSRCGPASMPISRFGGWPSRCLRLLVDVAPAVFGDFEIADAGRRHRGGDKSAGHRGLSKPRCRGKWVWYRQVI